VRTTVKAEWRSARKSMVASEAEDFAGAALE